MQGLPLEWKEGYEDGTIHKLCGATRDTEKVPAAEHLQRTRAPLKGDPAWYGADGATNRALLPRGTPLWERTLVLCIWQVKAKVRYVSKSKKGKRIIVC